MKTNTVALHKDCAIERLNQWQKNNGNTQIGKGDFVKMEFNQDKKSEWMWVEVNKILDKYNFEGNLSNDPLELTNIKIGDFVKSKIGNIAQLMKKENTKFKK